jgi:hypothetical protein
MTFSKVVLAGFCSLWLFALSAGVFYALLRLAQEMHII